MYTTKFRIGRLLLSGCLLFGATIPELTQTVAAGGWYAAIGIGSSLADLPAIFLDGPDIGWVLGIGNASRRMLSLRNGHYGFGNNLTASGLPQSGLCPSEKFGRGDEQFGFDVDWTADLVGQPF